MSMTTVYSKEVAGVLLLREDGALLMQHRDQKPGLPYAGLWSLPSGRKEHSESPEECAARELEEETGYRCKSLRYLAVMEDRDDTETDYLLTVFWAFYDGIQTLKCFEGQELRFVERSAASCYPMPAFMPDLWDRALKESSHG